MSFKKEILDLSIVIPTLGECELEKSINSIISGKYLPKEILLVIPIDYIGRLKSFYFNINLIKIIKTNLKGQVLQRIEGFKLAKSNFVMQLDSDIIIDNNSLYELFKLKKKYPHKTAIAPLMTPITINYKKKNFLINKFWNYLISGNFKMLPGKITNIGYNTWFHENDLINEIYKVDWLPGGCIIFNKKDLILNNFYPFSGKAYCEDVIHSIVLKEKGVNLFLIAKIKVNNIGAFNEKRNLSSFIREFKVRKYILNKLSGSKIKFYMWFTIYMINSQFYSK